MGELIILELRTEHAPAWFVGPAKRADALAQQVLAVTDWLEWCARTQTDPTARALVDFIAQTGSHLVAMPHLGDPDAPSLRHRLEVVAQPIDKSGWPGMNLTGYSRVGEESCLWQRVVSAGSRLEIARAAARISRRTAIASQRHAQHASSEPAARLLRARASQLELAYYRYAYLALVIDSRQ